MCIIIYIIIIIFIYILLLLLLLLLLLNYIILYIIIKISELMTFLGAHTLFSYSYKHLFFLFKVYYSYCLE